MPFDIAPATIEKIHRCPKWKLCLTGKLHFCCIINELNGEHLLVEPTLQSNCSDCPFHLTVADRKKSIHVCLCPVRKEIYQKYNE